MLPGRRLWPCPGLLQSEPSTIICSRSARFLTLTRAQRRVRPPDAAIRAARPSPRLEAVRRRLKAVEPAVPTPAVRLPLSGAASLPAAPERPLPAPPAVPLLRVNCAGAAAIAAPPRACSGWACLPAVSDKPRLCTPVAGTSPPSPLQ